MFKRRKNRKGKVPLKPPGSTCIIKSSPQTKRSLHGIRVGLRAKNASTSPLPEDLMSFDTRHSTPRAKGKHMIKQASANVFHRFDQRMKKNANKNKDSFCLPFSINFLSLLLPSENPSCTDDSASMLASTPGKDDKDSGAFSVISGQTTMAKDRVQETISSSVNIEYSFNSSPRSVDAISAFDDIPVNVDFVLESTEDELAIFAKSCIRSGRYRDAIDIYECVLDHYSQKEKDNRLVISALHNLGIVHTWNGNYSKALVYCNEAMKARRRKFGNGHVQVASSLQELGIIHYAREDFNKALGALREALQIHSKEPVPQGSESRMPSILNNIACIHFSMGKVAASLSTLEECLNMQRRSMGSVVGIGVDRALFNISIVLTNAATVTAKQGDGCRAASMMEEGLVIQQSVLPDDHRAVSSVAKSLSYIEATDVSSNLIGDKLIIDVDNLGPHQTIVQRMRNGCVDVTKKVTNDFDLPEDMHFLCAEMLSLGPLKTPSNGQGDRVQLNMNIERLPHALLKEGNSKRHCSWVDISNSRVSTKEQDFNFVEIARKTSAHIKVCQCKCTHNFRCQY